MTHSFLLGDGGPSRAAEAAPGLREYVGALGPSARTFTASHAPVGGRALTDDLVEFCGSWVVPDEARGDSGRRRKYANPGYSHAYANSDVVVECACGATLTRARGDSKHPILDDDKHRDGCMPYHRHRARADVSERRHELLLRLTRLGWRGPEIAERFGVSSGNVTSIAEGFGETMTSLRDRYRRDVAETYGELRDAGVAAPEIARVYGHEPETLSRWASRFR